LLLKINLPDTVFLHKLSASLPSLKCLNIKYKGGRKVGRFPTPSAEYKEDYHLYNIIMPYTSFDTISITCINSDYDGIVLAAKQVIDDVEHVQYFIYDFNTSMIECSFDEYDDYFVKTTGVFSF
jgi:hypothetical protein